MVPVLHTYLWQCFSSLTQWLAWANLIHILASSSAPLPSPWHHAWATLPKTHKEDTCLSCPSWSLDWERGHIRAVKPSRQAIKQKSVFIVEFHWINYSFVVVCYTALLQPEKADISETLCSAFLPLLTFRQNQPVMCLIPSKSCLRLANLDDVFSG